MWTIKQVEKYQNYTSFIISLFFSTLFFLPALAGKGERAGFVFEGDAWHAIAAQLKLSSYYSSNYIFSAIDFFTHNGASEFFLRPNYPVYNPIILIFSRVLVNAGPNELALFYVLMLFFYAVIGCFFCQKLLSEFLKLSFPISIFCSVTYVFSIQSVQTVWYLPYNIISWSFPVAIYFACMTAYSPSLRNFIFSSFVLFLIYLSGYLVLSVSAIFLSFIFSLGIIYFNEQNVSRIFVSRAVFCVVPFSISALLILPYMIELNAYHLLTERIVRNPPSLQEAAFSLSESPIFLMRIISNSLLYPGPRHELSLYWGVIPLVIFLIWLFKILNEREQFSFASDIRNFCLILYSFFVLIIFGKYSSVSVQFYYLFPIFGSMHIYQRYLLLANLFFIIPIGIMLNEIIYSKINTFVMIFIVGTLLLLFFVIHQNTNGQVFNVPVFLPDFIVELLILLIFLVALGTCKPKSVIYIATIGCFLISAKAMYDYSTDVQKYSGSKRNENLSFDLNLTDSLINFMKNNSDKGIIKYVDLSPNPHPFVEKNLPWFNANKFKMSSFFGYDWHIGVNYKYRDLMKITLPSGSPELAFFPDWEWIQKTGAEFVLFEQNNKFNDPTLNEKLDFKTIFNFEGQGRKWSLVKTNFKNFNFDNGYIGTEDSNATIYDFVTNNANFMEFKYSNSFDFSVSYLFWWNEHLNVTLDGNRLSWKVDKNLASIDLPAGNHTVKIIYQNRYLNFFLIIYLLFSAITFSTLCICLYNYMKKKMFMVYREIEGDT